MINRSQLKFHETFQPETVYLARVLELAASHYSGDKYDISERTGIPTGKQKGKVEPHIKYATFMGLINHRCDKGNYTLSLSPLGEVIYSEDRFLHENLTRWVCHYEISRKENGAPQWAYIVRDGHSGFLSENSTEHHVIKANALFGTNVSFEELFGVVKRSYLEGFFSELNYLKWDDNVKYIEHNESPELLYVYAYALLDSWSHLLPDKQEITVSELLHSLQIGEVFNLSEESIDSILSDLEYEGILKTNRQLYPSTVIRFVREQELLSKLYSRLL